MGLAGFSAYMEAVLFCSLRYSNGTAGKPQQHEQSGSCVWLRCALYLGLYRELADGAGSSTPTAKKFWGGCALKSAHQIRVRRELVFFSP